MSEAAPPGSGPGAGVDPALEAAYNCRAAVPDHEAIFARWARESEAARGHLTAYLRRDIDYGGGPRRTLDLFTAGGALPRPVLVFFHGGYWQAMDKSSFSFVAPPFVAAGAAVVVVNYPLAPAEPLEDITRAARGAVRLIWEDAHILGLDRRRIVVAGHSAGGHLVAELLATNWPRLGSGMPADLLRGGIAISGLFDLAPLIRTSLNAKLGLTERLARQSSPLFRDPAPGASLTLAVGGLESDAFHAQSLALAQRWAALGVNQTWITLPDRHHFSAMEALCAPDQALFHDALGRLGLTATGPRSDR